MTTRAARFKQSDLTRAMRGAAAAGMRVGRVEIDAAGKIVVMSEGAAATRPASSWDDLLQ